MHVSRQSPPTALYQLLGSIPFIPLFAILILGPSAPPSGREPRFLLPFSNPPPPPLARLTDTNVSHDNATTGRPTANFVSIRGFRCRAVINDGAEAPPPRSRLISPCASLLARPFNTLAIESSSQDWPERTETERMERKRGLDLDARATTFLPLKDNFNLGRREILRLFPLPSSSLVGDNLQQWSNR